MDFQFMPLELWRVSSLPQETKAVVAAYERCIAAQDSRAIVALRGAVERRIDDLENFYVAHVDDERSVLFEKQRLKLRKLLHEFESAIAPPQVPSQSAGSAAHAGGFEGVSASSGDMFPQQPQPTVTTRVVREDTRLTSVEMSAWFDQAGRAEMPEVSMDVVEGVYANVTRVNTDGRMSIRELRQWYTTFGKKALQAAAAASSSGSQRSTGTGSHLLSRDHGIVAPALASGAAMSKQQLKHPRGATAASLAAVAAASSSAAPSTAATAASRPIYAWETAGSGADQGATTGTGSSGGLRRGSAPAPEQPEHFSALPNGMLEFQVRLTPEEYHALCIKRRNLDAEGRYKARMVQAHEKHAAAATQKGGDPSYHVPGTPFSSFPLSALTYPSPAIPVLRGPYSTGNKGDSVLYRSSGPPLVAGATASGGGGGRPGNSSSSPKEGRYS